MSKYARIKGAPERIERAVDDLVEEVQHQRDVKYKPLSADGWLAVKAVVLSLLADLDEMESGVVR